MSLATMAQAWPHVKGPGAPTTTQTKCIGAVQIPGNPLRSFDISWVDPDRAEYYLGRSLQRGVEVIDTRLSCSSAASLALSGSNFPPSRPAVDNNLSGRMASRPWALALCRRRRQHTQVFDLNAPTCDRDQTDYLTGGTTRVDEMALTTDGKLLLAANNAEDPPFATLFSKWRRGHEQCHHNRQDLGRPDDHSNRRRPVARATGLGSDNQAVLHVDPDHRQTIRPDVQYGQTSQHLRRPITCHGGMLVDRSIALSRRRLQRRAPSIRPPTPEFVPLNACSPNGVHDRIARQYLVGLHPGQ